MSEEPERVADEPLDPFADPAGIGTPPPAARPHTPGPETAEQRERRCPFHKNCTCDHTECRDGWLDAWEVIGRNGREYPAVRRCPRCRDAQEMTSELAGMRGKRKRA